MQQSRTQEESIIPQGTVGGMEEPRSIKLLILPPFSGADPVPKEEASWEQWVWQAKEALKSCTVGAVQIAIIQSVRGEVREFAVAVSFEESVEMLLDKVEDRFGEKWTADSIRFCYKREEIIYEELSREAVAAKKEKNSEIKVTSLKVKSAIVGEDQNGIQDLKQKIDALMTMVKSSILGGAKLKQNNGGTTTQKMKDNGKNNGNTYKGRGPATMSAGLFKPGQKLFQCYSCGGWGHS